MEPNGNSVRGEAIRLLLDGHSVKAVSESLNINKNTIISWRTSHKKQHGVEFPSHRKGTKNTSIPNYAYKYTDDEVISIARLNQGYGFNRFVDKLYPGRKRRTELRFRFMSMFDEFKEETGEDLFEFLQDPEFIVMVSEKYYRKITGRKQVPKGFGRSLGSRGRKKKFGKEKIQNKVAMEPQIFNWGEYRRPDERDWRYVEEYFSKENHGIESLTPILPDVKDAVELLSLFVKPWEDAVKLFELFREGELDLNDPGPYLFLPAAKSLEWFWRAIFLPSENFSERHFNVPRAAKVLRKVARKSLEISEAKYISGNDPNPEVVASGGVWDLWSKRIHEQVMLEEWKKIEKVYPKIWFRSHEYRHCLMKPFGEIIEEFRNVLTHMEVFISSAKIMFPEISE